MITLDVDEATIRARWAEVLEKRNCMEIYEYLYNDILNEGRIGEYTLTRQFIVKLLKMAKESDLPCEPGPYGNLKQDIEHYIEVFSKDAT
jgi:hypothetical protein